MKKVSFMKLNLQQENLLSKEERKEVLGGYGDHCYVQCNDGNYTITIDQCTSSAIESQCGYKGAFRCDCY